MQSWRTSVQGSLNDIWFGYTLAKLQFNPFTADPVKALQFAILV